jgi:CBS domain-containing protein
MAILDLCDKESAAVHPESTVAEAIRLMLARRVGAVVVVDANRLRQTKLHNYIRKLLLTVDEFMALLKEC